MELGDLDKGVEKYLEAAEIGENAFSSPIFLLKAGEIYEIQQKYSDAMIQYEKIKNEYSESSEGATIDKYIARVKLLIK